MCRFHQAVEALCDPSCVNTQCLMECYGFVCDREPAQTPAGGCTIYEEGGDDNERSWVDRLIATGLFCCLALLGYLSGGRVVRQKVCREQTQPCQLSCQRTSVKVSWFLNMLITLAWRKRRSGHSGSFDLTSGTAPSHYGDSAGKRAWGMKAADKRSHFQVCPVDCIWFHHSHIIAAGLHHRLQLIRCGRWQDGYAAVCLGGQRSRAQHLRLLLIVCSI